MQKQKNGGVEAGSFTYDYYANGNVKQIKSGSTVKVAYGYDEFNRLIAEINYAAGKKFAYTYDSAGNVLTKYTYNITNNVIAAVASDVTTYGYTNPLWRDQLTKINNRYTIEYDAAGNPVKYKDYALEWKGDRLTKFDNTTFAYDINGLRLKKNDVEFCYFNDKLLFSPDRLKGAKEIAGILKKGQKFYDYGGTLVRLGKFAHIDVSTKALLHLAAFRFKHIPIGTVIAGIIRGF